MRTWLEIDTEPSLAFYRDPASRSPIDADRIAMPRLVAVGPLRSPMAIPGVLAAETPNVRVDLDNADAALTTRWRADAPLRAVARVMSDSGEMFSGLVTDIDLSATTSLVLQAGFVRPMTDKMPLRDTTDWGVDQDERIIPVPYGRVTVKAVPYDGAGLVWVIADGVIGGVDTVAIEGAEILAWAWKPGVDRAGKPVSFLTLEQPAAEAPDVTLRGRVHPQRGTLMETPDEILWDVLTNVCGLGIAPAKLDAFRAEVADLRIGGVLDDASISIRAQIDRIMQSCGAAWSIVADGVAALWPFVDDGTPAIVQADALTMQDISASATHADLVNALRVKYDYDWSTGRHARSLLIVDAESIRLYGRIEADWDAGWLHHERLAKDLGDRLIPALSRPRWTVEWTSADLAAKPGDWVDIDHPDSPISGRARLLSAEPDQAGLRTRLLVAGVVTQAPPSTSEETFYRLTESGDIRITESGDARILE